MTDISKWGAAPPLAAVAFCVCAALCGCGKGPEKAPEPSAVPPPRILDRMADPVYTNALHSARRAQESLARRQGDVARAMEAMKAKARKNLPEGAKEEQVLAELDSNPAKYPGWAETKDGMKRISESIERERLKTRNLVRERIAREAEDRKAAGAAAPAKK